MKFIKQIERFQKLDTLLKAECIGTPIELANKLGVSRSHVYRLIEMIRDYGALIEYSRKTNSFYYVHPFCIDTLFSLNSLTTGKMEIISGGFCLKKIVTSFFMRRNAITFTTDFT